jgi:transposase-like protein
MTSTLIEFVGPTRPQLPKRPWSAAKRKQVLQMLEHSGLRVTEFANLHGVKPHVIYGLQERARKSKAVAPPKLLPVKLPGEPMDVAPPKKPTSRSITIHAPNGFVVKIDGDICTSQLTAALQAIAEVAC